MIDERVVTERVRPAAYGRFVLVVALIAALAGLLFGYDTGVISGAIIFIRSDFPQFVVSVVFVGAMASALLAGDSADVLGRRRRLIGAALLFACATIASALAPNVSVLVPARFVVGFAIGLSSLTAPLYISEIVPPERRAALVALYQWAITLSILFATWSITRYRRRETGARWLQSRVRGYYDTSTVSEIKSELSRFVLANSPALAFLPSTTYNVRYGYWIQADHLIAGSVREAGRGLAAFAAYEYGDPRTSLISSFVDAGIVQRGTFPGRHNDNVSPKFALADVNPRLRDF